MITIETRGDFLITITPDVAEILARKGLSEDATRLACLDACAAELQQFAAAARGAGKLTADPKAVEASIEAVAAAQRTKVDEAATAAKQHAEALAQLAGVAAGKDAAAQAEAEAAAAQKRAAQLAARKAARPNVVTTEDAEVIRGK